jgi:predicted metalloprotease with PDZ domain
VVRPHDDRVEQSDVDQGGKAGKKPKDEMLQRGSLGVSVGSGDDGAHLMHVHEGSAAQLAGLSAGDVIIAVDGLRATRGNLSKLVGDRAPGTKLRVHAFRRDEMHEVDVVLKAPELEAAYFTLRTDVDADKKRAQWLRR